MTEDEFMALVNSEIDTFRLAIRGHAAIDEKLDELLADAFVTTMPSFLKFGFDKKLQVVLALGLVPNTFKDPIGRLTKLRTDFAHGRLVTLEKSRAKELLGALPSIAPSLDISSWPGDPRQALMLALSIVWFGLAACETSAKKHRDEVKMALASHQFGVDRISYLLSQPSPTVEAD